MRYGARALMLLQVLKKEKMSYKTQCKRQAECTSATQHPRMTIVLLLTYRFSSIFKFWHSKMLAQIHHVA